MFKGNYADKLYTDILILGGGAAGLCASIHAARTLKKHNKNGTVMIAENNPRVGKKLLSTGNGRCNLAHEPALDLNSYHGDHIFARKILEQSKGYEEFFQSLGLYCKTDGEGRVYPYNQSATAVLDALRLECAALGIIEQVNFNCVRIEPLIEGYMLVSENAYIKNTEASKKGKRYENFENSDDSKNICKPAFITARRLIITCGGMAGAGGGDVFKPLRELGVKIIDPLPTLSPIRVPPKLTGSLKGLRVAAKCSVIIDGKIIGSETGEVQIGDGYLSGICVMNLSRFVSLNSRDGNKITISLDLAPDITLDNLLDFINNAVRIRRLSPLEDLLSGLLHNRLGVLLIKQVTGLPLNRTCDCFTEKESEELAFLIKDWRFPALPPDLKDTGWKQAQCTAGGVPASELTDTLMHVSKNKAGLFVAGEAVNVDGDCGGYNLAWAWASGEVAGIAAAVDLIK